MEAEVRSVLRDLIDRHGVGLMRQPRRLEGLLRDLCPEDLKEVSVLVEALEQGVPSRISRADQRALNALARQLSEQSGVAMRWAIWAVESWSEVVATDQGPRRRARPRSRVMEREGSLQALLGGGEA